MLTVQIKITFTNRVVCRVRIGSSRGDGVSHRSQHLCRAAAALLSLHQQSSLLPVVSKSLVALHRTSTSPVRQTEQLQSTQSVCTFSRMILTVVQELQCINFWEHAVVLRGTRAATEYSIFKYESSIRILFAVLE